MDFIALKMLLGDRAKYVGIVIGLTFASFLVTWPSAIFTGVMSRTFSFVTDIGLPDIWVVDPTVQYIEDVKPMRDTEVLRVRGTEGVEWAVGLYKGMLQAPGRWDISKLCNRGSRRFDADRWPTQNGCRTIIRSAPGVWRYRR